MDLYRAASLFLVSLTPETPQENVFGQRIFGDFFSLSPVAYMSSHAAKQSLIANVPVAVRGFV